MLLRIGALKNITVADASLEFVRTIPGVLLGRVTLGR